MAIDPLRAATEDDVTAALKDSWISLPITTPAEALELFNAILDHMTGERARVMREDEEKISKERRQRSH